ncbi:hypothetical protein GQ53DRAFT_782616 [Thozetella sp. PMI_491]|nr:hypothetical protein GQ53DRAFT_782616 [Thozetella sp. PMI_491]
MPSSSARGGSGRAARHGAASPSSPSPWCTAGTSRPSAALSRIFQQAAPQPTAELSGQPPKTPDAGSPPSMAQDKTETTALPRALLPDASLYMNPYPDPEDDGTSLEELAHLARLSRYQERKRANTRIRLQRSLVSTALSARLMRAGDTVHRNLVDCFRGDDKKTFAALYNAMIDVRKSCEETRRYGLLEPDMEVLQPNGMLSSESLDTATESASGAPGTTGPILSFLSDISASARETFLSFLTQIRTNPDYLATRLSCLNQSELVALTSFHPALEPIESVLPYHSRVPGRSATSTPSLGSSAIGGQERGAIERLLSFQRHDPLSALVYTCFANSAGPDTAEDRRRTGIWATTCARLMSSPKTGRENIVISILNVWISMRDWAGRSNMEWYLMKILEDGSFLLDRAEDQHGTRFHLSNFTAKDAIAAEEFYTRAVEELFEIIDDEDATGIPEGLIELGNEILKRVDKRLVEDTRKWLVTKCLFTQWLLGVMIHPEAYGMMADYHITEYGRQKILKAVATHAQKLVIDMLTSKTPVSTPPKIAGHIKSIYGRFESSRSRRKTRLLPARSITSLRETAEVHPYLVISPADLAVLVNALFPERRPQSAQSGSFRSGAPSISGFSALSQPLSSTTRQNPNNFDTMSVVSTSAESVFSDATSGKEPLLDEQNTGSSRRSSPPVQDQATGQRAGNYEDDGYRLRLAMHEMLQSLGQEVVFGSCHPCAERWAVLFISADGNRLSTQMTYDPDDDNEAEENSSTSDTDQEELDDDRPELDKDYHQLRDSILKLVEEFEIPQDPEVDGSKAQTFSYRASRLKKYRSKNRIITSANSMASRNPYRQRTESFASSLADSPPKSIKGKEAAGQSEDEMLPSSVLISMLTAAESQSRAQSDFVSAHLYWRTLRQLNALSSETLRRNGFATLLNIFSRGPRDSIRRSASAIEEYDAWLVWLKQGQERAEGQIESMMRRLRALRDKMWYVTDVRNSAPYEDSRNIAVALKTMGVPHRWEAFQRARNTMQRGPAASYIFRTESQVLDLVAAPEAQGGPNKLKDEQAEKTARWLQQYGIENFCSGEERIHRFCCEVESCVIKLVGDNILDGPVLWSSELYLRDRRTLESARSTRDTHNWEDSASVISDSERRYGSSAGRAPSITRDLRAISTQNLSQASFDSGRFSFSRASTVLSDAGHDGPDYFGVSSPVHTIDPTMTYWSPFTHGPVSPSVSTSRAHSPTTSMTSLSGTLYPQHNPLPSHSQHSGRPGTSTSSNETVLRQRLTEEKTRFLSELKQTLTSLLLSDLGNLVFARGSETDAWFADLGQECIDRKEEIQRRERQAALASRKVTAKSSPKPQRVIEKKRSFGDLRGVGANDSYTAKTDSSSMPLSPGVGAGSQGNESSATSDTIPAKGPAQAQRKDPLPDFPFTKAYQRLLKMFCVHPNPYAKLNALFELEHLIIASLNSGSRKSRLAWARSELQSKSAAADEHGPGGGRPQPLEEAIDNVKERRSHALIQSPVYSPGSHAQAGRTSGGAGNMETRSIAATAPVNTDAITNVLQYLFRDPTLRPKTLFRDLQFISSLVPASVLDKTDRGKAFWDTGLAALSIKQEVCRTMVEVADDIVKHYTQTHSGSAPSTTRPSGNAGVASASSVDGQDPPVSPSTPPLPLTTHSLADAARMWSITAKEGDPTAQRELAIFYLSNPELVERTTFPLTKPLEVFKQAVMDKYGGGRSGGSASSSSRYPGGAGGSRGQGQSGAGGGAAGRDTDRVGDVRSDPALMCIAIHWMEAAERGGDELARMFLGQNEIGGGLMG